MNFLVSTGAFRYPGLLETTSDDYGNNKVVCSIGIRIADRRISPAAAHET